MRIIVAILAIAGAICIGLPAQSPPPKFDAAAIHLCEPAGRGGGGRSGPPAGATSPGRLSEGCKTMSGLIREAYQTRGRAGPAVFANTPIEGGPAWVNSDRYSIQATAEGAPSVDTMRGVMLQGLLEERFHLKVHTETKPTPVYEMTVAKGGPKLQATVEGSCVPAETARLTPGLQPCGMLKRVAAGGELSAYLIGETMADLCGLLSLPDSSDRPVVDRTGIAGMFDLSIPDFSELFAMRRAGPNESIPDPLDKLRALVQRFGLNLVLAKAPAEFLVIDHLERPSEN